MPAPPLDGVRVLDCSRLLPAPYCSRLLADLGADVLRVDHPEPARGDMVRGMGPAFTGLNHGKGSVSLDLTVAADREHFLALVERADVVLESFRPGVLDRLGAGWDAIHARNPAAVLCSITGYGQTGPDAFRAGHDIGYLARAGVLGLSGEADRPPLPLGVQVADLAGGALPGVIGILAALRERDGAPGQPGSGLGQHVDVSMTDGSRALLQLDGPTAIAGETELPRGSAPLGGAAMACYRTYACADGHVALGALEPKFWRAWCAGVERDDLVAQQYAPPSSDAGREVEGLFAQRTRDQWETFAAEHDCCLEPILSPAESYVRAAAEAAAPSGHGFAADRIAPTIDAIDVDGSPRRVPAPGLRFSRSPLAAGGAAPGTGADNALLTDAAALDARWPAR
jgi:crotonobetainyl-CoA:carnitine CoA-transferase CaiB-like acyl-CoA transferase